MILVVQVEALLIPSNSLQSEFETWNAECQLIKLYYKFQPFFILICTSGTVMEVVIVTPMTIMQMLVSFMNDTPLLSMSIPCTKKMILLIFFYEAGDALRNTVCIEQTRLSPYGKQFRSSFVLHTHTHTHTHTQTRSHTHVHITPTHKTYIFIHTHTYLSMYIYIAM